MYCYLCFSIPEPEVFAHLNTRVERLDAEVHGAVHVAQVRQLDPENGCCLVSAIIEFSWA